MGGDIGRLVAGITLFATGANHSNIDHAMFAGGNSAENNAFFIPALIFAFNTLMVALLAQSLKETVEEVWDIIENPENLTDEVIEAKVKELLVDKLIEMGIEHILRLKLVKKGKEAILEAIEDWSAADVLDKMIDHATTIKFHLLTGRGMLPDIRRSCSIKQFMILECSLMIKLWN